MINDSFFTNSTNINTWYFLRNALLTIPLNWHFQHFLISLQSQTIDPKSYSYEALGSQSQTAKSDNRFLILIATKRWARKVRHIWFFGDEFSWMQPPLFCTGFADDDDCGGITYCWIAALMSFSNTSECVCVELF